MKENTYSEEVIHHDDLRAMGMTRPNPMLYAGEQGNHWQTANDVMHTFTHPEHHRARLMSDEDDHSYYRGQPRTASGRFRRMHFAAEYANRKEEVAEALAEEWKPEDLAECAVKEASELIKAATEKKHFEMFKEFAELCIIMKALAEFLPEGIDEAATEEAITYYERKTGHHRSRNAFEEYDRRSKRY
jgi:hypothetical protein